MLTALRSVAAVAGGYAVMALLVIALGSAQVSLHADFPAAGGGPRLPPPWYALDLACKLGFAVAGGYAAARLAPHSPRGHAWALAVLIVVVGAAVMGGERGPAPWWWTAGETAAGVAGVLIGGRVRGARRVGG